MRNFILAPHDIAWKAHDCERCFWLKTRGISAPGARMPSIFRHIDTNMKKSLTPERLRELGIPVKELATSELRILSAPYEFPELDASISFNGYPDRIAFLEDGTVGILEYKTSEPSKENIAQYWMQVMPYVWSMENPVKGEPCEVSGAWMIYWTCYEEPMFVQGSRGAQRGVLTSVPMDIDRARFWSNMEDIAVMLVGELPPPSPICEICRHVETIRDYETRLSARVTAVG